MVASVPSMIGQFNMENIKILQELGYEVEVACNFYDRSVWDDNRVQEFIKELKQKRIKTYQIDFSRNSKNMLQHIKTYHQLELLLEKRKYNFIHCHTPIASTITRLVAHKNDIKVIYTAHGFHFFKGAPIQNWILYYPVERFLSRYTDVLLTINKEDYNRAKTFRAKKIEYIPGVGIDIGKFKNCKVDVEKKKEELGIPKYAKVLLSVGELNKNKNHIVVIKALSKLKRKNIYYLICGKGKEDIYLKKIAKQLGIGEQVILTGFIQNIEEIYHIADIFIFPSKREGLGLAAVEAMASGLPLVTSNVHGINDYSINGISGYKVNPTDIDGFYRTIKYLLEKEKLCDDIKENNKKNAENFSGFIVQNKMKKIYKDM